MNRPKAPLKPAPKPAPPKPEPKDMISRLFLGKVVFIQGRSGSRYIGKLIDADKEFVCLEGVKIVTDKGGEREVHGPFCLRRQEVKHIAEHQP